MVLRWMALGLMMTGCDAALPEGCTTPDEGDLEGYCVVGEQAGTAAALADMAACVSEETPSLPAEVAEGPGDCGDEVSSEVLEAEQAAYEDCWFDAYEVAYTGPGDTC